MTNAHKCLIGLRSSNWIGHCNKLKDTSCYLNHSFKTLAIWIEALFNWKITRLGSNSKSRIVEDKSTSKICLYKNWFTFLLILMKSPQPWIVKYAHTKINPPPCFSVCWTCKLDKLDRPSRIQHHDRRWELKSLILLSYEKITLFDVFCSKFWFLLLHSWW